MKKDESKTDARPYKPTMFESARETIDSIAIAFILAFLFRTFEAEAFVIPTGSMALTLMGAHKDLDCPECGLPYRAGASTENPDDPNRQQPVYVTSSTCPNCRYTANYKENPPPTYNGDRILVTKYSYEFRDPQRFDVAVFKNPSEAKQNYIKRVVGLPNEEVLIYRGDIYARGKGEQSFKIQRKPPEKIVSVAQLVYDNDYVLKKLFDLGWPQRWQSKPDDAPAEARWKVSEDFKSFQTTGKSADLAWLRYQHIVPTSSTWRQAAAGAIKAGDAKPQLIADFCEYNTSGSDGDVDLTSLGVHWVSDLILECELQFLDRSDDKAEAVLELVEGGRAFQCRIQAATGDVELRISGVDAFHPKAKAAVVGPGAHKLRFANVDDHLVFWVNDKPVVFDASTHFLATNFAPVINTPAEADPQENRQPLDGDTQLPVLDLDIPKQQDLESPVGIAARGVGLNVAHVRILRDSYYVANSKQNQGAYLVQGWRANLAVTDYYQDVFAPFRHMLQPGVTTTLEESLQAFMSDVKEEPSRWRQLRAVSFPLAADQFFVLGDNSPHSLDGRLWDSREYFVKRELLIGKALFVYWPHGFSRIPGTGIDLFDLPFLGNSYWPNFGKMRLIR